MAPSPRRLASALARDPRATTMPVSNRTPRPQMQASQPQPQPQPQPLTRLSPGVYRDASGNLVNQQGGMLPNQPQRGGMTQSYFPPGSQGPQPGGIPGARQDMAMMPPNVEPMPKGGYRNMPPMESLVGRVDRPLSPEMAQQIAQGFNPQQADIMQRIRSGNLPQMPGNNMISRGVNQAVQDLGGQVMQKYPQYFGQQQMQPLPQDFSNQMNQLYGNMQNQQNIFGPSSDVQNAVGGMQQSMQPYFRRY